MADHIEQHMDLLIQHSISFASELLGNYKEFYPFAAFVDLTGGLIPIAVDSEEEYPDTEALIAEYERIFADMTQQQSVLAWSIAIDASVTNKEYPRGTDAIAIKTWHGSRKEQILYFFPYSLGTDIVNIGEGWSEFG